MIRDGISSPFHWFQGLSAITRRKLTKGRDGANVETNEFSGWMLSSHYRRKRENDTRAQFSRLRVSMLFRRLFYVFNPRFCEPRSNAVEFSFICDGRFLLHFGCVLLMRSGSHRERIVKKFISVVTKVKLIIFSNSLKSTEYNFKF